MPITKANGTITTTASEQDLFDITADANFAVWIHLHNMQSGDTYVIKIYVKDANAAAMRLAENETFIGEQNPPSHFIAWYPADQFKVTIQRTGGTDRAVTWQRFQSSFS